MSSSVDGSYWIGFDLGGTKMLAALFDDDLKLVAQKRKKTRAHAGVESSVERIKKLVHDLLDQEGVELSQVRGMCVGCPGPLDLNEGIVKAAPNLNWQNVPIVNLLEKEFGCSVVIANDVDLGVYAEYLSGAAQSARCVLGVFPGTGIGGGCVYEGKILRGAVNSCMEIGHTLMLPEGPVCSCGLRGCLEAVASRLAISSAAAAAAHRGQAPFLYQKIGTTVDKIRSSTIAASIAAGDLRVQQIVETAAEYIGRAVAGLVHLISPDVIVLGGGLAEAMPEIFRDRITLEANARVLPPYVNSFRVVIAELGDDAGITGAAAWAKKMIQEK